MNKGFKRTLSLVFAVIMIFAACIPAFAAEQKAEPKKNDGIAVTITTALKDYYREGETIEISAKITNNSNEARDIELKVSPTAFMKIETINGEKKFSKTIVFENVKPGEAKTVTVKGVATRQKLGTSFIDVNYSLIFGKYTVWLYRLNAFFKANVATAHFFFGDTAAAVMFTANDITPEPETATEVETDAAA